MHAPLSPPFSSDTSLFFTTLMPAVFVIFKRSTGKEVISKSIKHRQAAL
jgi:hypothetical protein